jgi:phosphoglycerate kinase
MGRPKGKPSDKLRLDPAARRLGELLGMPVKKINSVVGPEATAAASVLKDGEILMLENVRFEPGEEKNDEALSKALAALAELYVNDAFGTAHRAHSSTVGVAKFLPQAAAGNSNSSAGRSTTPSGRSRPSSVAPRFPPRSRSSPSSPRRWTTS